MNKYNLDEVENEAPLVVLGGNEYHLKYPTVEDVERIQGLESDQEKMDTMFGFLEPVKKDAPSFQEAIRKQNIKVMMAFNDMIKEEFGVDEIVKS